MKQILAFDVYGTLINTNGVFRHLQQMLGERANPFMEQWRQKQLEYSFRRGLMNRHVDFSICTRQALQYTCSSMDVQLNDDHVDELMKAYTALPAFPEVEKALTACRDDGHKLYAFSNGSLTAVRQLMDHAGITGLFDGMISTEDVAMFKPSPVVYQHFIDVTTADKHSAWLISGNSFDVIGALSYGMQAAWVQRSPDLLFDPWEYTPTAIIQDLTELPDALRNHSA